MVNMNNMTYCSNSDKSHCEESRRSDSKGGRRGNPEKKLLKLDCFVLSVLAMTVFLVISHNVSIVLV